MRKTIDLKWWAACCGLAASLARVEALEARDFLLFDWGPLSLRPQLNIDTQYNDNIFYRDQQEVADLVMMVSPAMKIQVGEQLPESNRASIQYTVNRLFYLERSDQNATQHRISTELRYGTERTVITGRDRIDFLSSVLGGGFGLSGTKVDRLVVTDVYRLDYRISAKTGVYGQAEHVLTDFEEGVPLFDRQRMEGTLGAGWRYSDRTTFFGEVFYGRSLLQDNGLIFDPPDSRFVGGFLGVSGRFTDRLSGRLKLGYESTTFSDGSPAGDAPAVDASLTFLATDRLTLNLLYARRQQVSVQYIRSAYISDNVSFRATQILGSTGRLRLSASIDYEMFNFEPAPPAFNDRSDNQMTTDLSLTWFFEAWLAARVSYAFDYFSSTLPRTQVVDYRVNRVTLSLAIGF